VVNGPKDWLTTMEKSMQEKFNISLVQPGFDVGPTLLNVYYLPYTVGLLWAYAKQNKAIEDNFNVNSIIFSRMPFYENLEKLKKSKIVFFSVYVWNWKISLRLAEELKKSNPDIITVFGGPSIPHGDKDLFLKYPQIDTIVVGEGEQVFEEILLSYLENKTIDKIIRAERLKDLKIPSPYLEGIFDEIMAENPDIIWNPTLETDRGCPYKCTFCDWGGLTNAKIHKFELDRVFAELEWFSKNNCDFISCTAANFGVFKERDMMIAQKMVDEHQKHGVIRKFQCSYAKNSNADVLEIIKLLNEGGVNAQFLISLQTFTQQALENVERKNMKLDEIARLTTYANKRHLPMGTELIIGLPGETYDSWKDTMSILYEKGFHSSLDIFSLQVIENAPMNMQRQQFDLKTFSAYDMLVDVTNFEDVELGLSEEIQVIKSNSTMSQDDLIKSYKYSSQVLALHNSGISDLISIYLYKSHGVTYREFYEGAIEYLEDDFKEWSKQLEDSLYKWHDTGIFDTTVGEDAIKIYSWAIPYIIPMQLHYNKKVPYFIDKISEYVSKKWNVDKTIIEDYNHISKHRVKYWGNYYKEQGSMDTLTNLYDYTFNNEDDLIYKKQSYTIDDQYYREYGDDIISHTEFVLYGRQRRWHLHKVNKKDK